MRPLLFPTYLIRRFSGRARTKIPEAAEDRSFPDNDTYYHIATHYLLLEPSLEGINCVHVFADGQL